MKRLLFGLAIVVGCGSKQGEPEAGLASIPAGKAWLNCFPLEGVLRKGCETPKGSLEELRHIDVPAFEIDRLETTAGEYQKCVAAKKCTPSEIFASAPAAMAITVSSSQAKAYCAYRSMRLPTEAEWEKAARGADDVRPYPWGNAPPSCENTEIPNCPANDSRVKNGASPFGVYHLADGVPEWTTPYEQRPKSMLDKDMIIKGLAIDLVGGEGMKPLRLLTSNEMQSDGSGEAGIRCARAAGAAKP